jgi:hypothetical protein
MKTGLTFTHASIQEMAQGEVKALISDHLYNAVKEADPHPLFVALSLAHEGKSYGRIIGRRGADMGAEKIWPRSRIHELVKLINKAINPRYTTNTKRAPAQGTSGIPLYLFHNRDNSPRKPVGRILTAISRHIRGKVHAVGLAYITEQEVKKKIRKGELDTCSIEAELEFQSSTSKSAGREWIVNAVKKITGIALGSKAFQKPGFAEAGILAAVQEFDDEIEDTRENQKDMDGMGTSELNRKLQDREEKIRNMEAEMQRLKEDVELNRKKEKIVELAGKYIDGTNLSPMERSFLMEDLKELSHSFDAGSTDFEKQLANRVRQKLERIDQLRRYYNATVLIPAPPEGGPANQAQDQRILSNPLIPRD